MYPDDIEDFRVKDASYVRYTELFTLLESELILPEELSWSSKDIASFVDSILKNIQIPSIYIINYNRKSFLIDGLQRISSLKAYITGQSNIEGDNLVSFSDRSYLEKSLILNSTIYTIIVEATNQKMVKDIIERINPSKTKKLLNRI
jgi:hypothetical protein